MASETNKPQNQNNGDFGLPKTEFKPIESSGNSSWLKITLIIAGIVLVIGIGVVFWLFQRPSSGPKNDFMANTLENHQAEEEEDEFENQTEPGSATKSITDLSKTKPVDTNVDIKTTKKSKESVDSDDAALEELDKISDSFITKPEHKPSSFIEQLRAGEFDYEKTDKGEEPSIMTIMAPQGLYYVVVASHIDMDLAMDYAQKIVQKQKEAQKEAHVKVILPEKGKYFVRVAVAHKKSLEEANQKAQELKGEYGENIWVMKY